MEKSKAVGRLCFPQTPLVPCHKQKAGDEDWRICAEENAYQNSEGEKFGGEAAEKIEC